MDVWPLLAHIVLQKAKGNLVRVPVTADVYTSYTRPNKGGQVQEEVRSRDEVPSTEASSGFTSTD
jgi:hypothetical protein